MTLKIGLHGASGKMGQQVLQEISSKPKQFKLQKILSRTQAEPANGEHARVDQTDKMDVIIDFTLPAAIGELCKYCVLNQIPLVSGTTGLEQIHFDALKKLSQAVPVFWAPNMSLGIAVVAHMMKSLRAIDSWDFQIEEIHHNKKVDAPSGTAKWLQAELEKTIKDPPAPLSIRGGGVFGTHKIWAMSDSEVIRIEHEALNRAVFAKGALSAANWLNSQQPGFYGIDDMLKDSLK